MTNQPSLFTAAPLVPVHFHGTADHRAWLESVWSQHGPGRSCPVAWALKALENLQEIEATRPTAESAAMITERFYESMPKGEL